MLALNETMKIQWDMEVYGKMSAEVRRLCDESKNWILKHEDLSSKYYLDVDEKHPALWFARVMNNVEKGIDNKEENAVDLGCLYVIHAKKAPFGKIHKSNILVRLKRNKELIKKKYLQQLIKTLENLNQLEYPPREVRELKKLIKTMC